MLTFKKFSGINNVLPSHRLKSSELTEATNVDIGLSGELRRRQGYAGLLDTCHKNLHQADGFVLATVDGGDLVRMDADGGNKVTLYPSLGASRVWYCNLPDGRVTFSNGLINGITDGATATGWGVPVPDHAGSGDQISGNLFSGDYQWQITYVRDSDGLEGGPAYSNPQLLSDDEGVGILLSGLPTRAGYSINVYLSSHNGGEAFFAGNTTTGTFAYVGKNSALTLPCRTGNLYPAPAGTVTAFWRGRVLVAVSNALWASRTNQWELFDLRRDFKQFSGEIRLVQPVDGGIFVGTSHELAFLSGNEFDKLSYTRVVDGPVVLGSGVTVPGELIRRGQGVGQGVSMICIADGLLVAGHSDGSVEDVTEGRYETEVTEVAATFRVRDGIPQYLAVPQ